MSGPLVSVVIPTCRRPQYLQEALASVSAQTHRPLEIIVVDDAGDTGTEALVGEVLAGTLAWKVRVQDRRGPAAARNVGLALAAGTYIQFLDDDDTLFPDKIERQVAVLERRGVDVVFGDWWQGANLASARREARRTWHSHFAYLVGTGWVANFAYLPRLDVCRAIGGWDEELRFNDDFDFFLRLSARGATFCHVPDDAGFYRWHEAPKVSREQISDRARINAHIVRRATSSLQEWRAPTLDEERALVTRWSTLARDALGAPALFADHYAELQRRRRRAGLATPTLDRLLGAPLAFRVRHFARPVHWARCVVHWLLPQPARQEIRRWQRRLLSQG